MMALLHLGVTLERIQNIFIVMQMIPGLVYLLGQMTHNNYLNYRK